MRFIDNWLRQRTIYVLMTIYGFSFFCVATLILAPTYLSIFAIIPILMMWRCRLEAERRDDLIKSWADRDIFVITKK